MERKFRIIRYFLYAVELVTLFVIQGTPYLVPELFGGRPVLIIVAVLSIAMFEPKMTALFFGLAGGLLIDIGNGGVIGFFAILLTVLCYLTSHLTLDVIKTSLLTAMLISGAAVFSVLSLHFLFFYVLPNYGENGYFFTHHYLSRIVYTIVLTPIFYGINKTLALRIAAQD